MTLIIIVIGLIAAAVFNNPWIAVYTLGVTNIFLWLRLNFIEKIVQPWRRRTIYNGQDQSE